MRVLFLWLLATAFLISGLFQGLYSFQAVAGDAGSTWKSKNIERIATIRTLILDRAESCQEKDLGRCMSFYNRRFRSEGLDYAGWQEKKARLFKRSGSISLEVSDLWGVIEDNHASASFIQH